MDQQARIERTLELAVRRVEVSGGPPRLAAAIRYAVFPGGARIRPRLCLAVAAACGADLSTTADAGAAAIELLHCASLVHDDLPCFDDAAIRRGKPSVHHAFGEQLAVLAGDALIVLAFESLATALADRTDLLAPMLLTLTRAVGAPTGIIAGQAWESETAVPLETYQRAKTGSLFVAATMLGAIAGNCDANSWRALGEYLGEAYQVADDICDATADPAALGKPIGRDAALGRPSTMAHLGIAGSIERLKTLVSGAVAAIPPCPGADDLGALVRIQARSILPSDIARLAA